MTERIPLTEEEKKISYSYFYDFEMTEIPKEKLDVLKGGPMKPEDILDINDRNRLFDSGYFNVETGFGIAKNGTGYVSNLTPMKGITKEMFEWWFAWHSLEDLRYRIWDPEDHFYARQQIRERTMDSSLPMRERTWGTIHRVMEDVGLGAEEILLEFHSPKDMGYDQEKVGSKYCASMMCANGHGIAPGQGLIAVMTHMIREIADGIELRSRFWLGYQIIDGKAVKVIPDGIEIPMAAPQALFSHNIKEFSHLAAILPKVYEQEKNNW